MRAVSIVALLAAIVAAVQGAPLDSKDLAAANPRIQMLCPWVPGCIKKCNGDKDCIQFCIDDCPRRGDRDFAAAASGSTSRPQMLCPWVPGCIKRCNGDKICIQNCIDNCPPRRDDPWV